jgi:hypothetical protein
MLSPAVFALPGASGFSAPMEREVAMLPPPEPPGAPISFIRNGAPFTPTTYGETKVALADLIDQPRDLARPDVEPLSGFFSSVPEKTSPALAFVWQEVSGSAPPGLDAAGLPVATSEVPWQASASICFNDDGFASQVMLERPSPEPAMNDALVRLLRGTVFDVPAGEPCRRLVLRYQPATQSAASAP